MKRPVLLALLIATSAVAQTTDPNASRGFQAGKLYNFHGLDSVAPFDGNLSLRIPIGQVFTVRPGFTYQFMLSYNSKVWDYEIISASERRAAPEWDSNTSLGWTFGLGRLLDEGVNGWVYLSADGARHDLGVPDASGYSYTRNGSYIRAKRTPASGTLQSHTLEFADGLTHTFNSGGMLVEIRDRFGNWVQVDYTTPNVWKVEDGFGTGSSRKVERTHKITFEAAPLGRYARENFQTRVKTVELAAFGSAIAKYTFSYLDTTIPNSSCGVRKGEFDPERINVPLLDKIELPDLSRFTMSYVTHEVDECTSGSIDQLTLPTGGAIRWTHGEYKLASEDCTLDPTGVALGWTYTYPGVKKRELLNAEGTVLESTTYDPVLLDAGSGSQRCGSNDVTIPFPPQVMRNTVKTGGDLTEHYFSAYRSARSTFDKGQQRVDYGLPFTRILPIGNGQYQSTAIDGKYLSTRMYAGANQLQRTTYLNYERDSSTFTESINSRVKDSRTVFETDFGDPGSPCRATDGSTTQCWVDRSQSDYDGFGHYREQTISSNFPGVVNRSDARTVKTNFNPGRLVWPTSEPWILNTYTTTSITENNVTQTISTTMFEASKGVVRAVKRGNGSDALVSVTCRDDRGFPTSERAFGGSVSPPADLCSETHVRQDGESILKHTWRFTNPGQITHETQYDGATLKSTNEVLDLDTWLPKQTTDPAGLVTTYSYDSAGRITSLQPPGVKPTTYDYTNASVETVTWEGGSSIVFKPAHVEARTTSATLGAVKSQFQYDAAGRLWREKTLMPDETWTVRETLFDTRGNKASTSESETLVVLPRSESAPPGSPDPTEVDFEPVHKTIFTNYDTFGRVGAITTSDGKQTSMSYHGTRVTTRTQHVAGMGGEAYISTEERSDAHGRLISVTEGAGTPTTRTTSYGYDILGNLESVSMPGMNGTQTRTFHYDDHGMLAWEEHPELGATGYGRTEYLDYDASGRFGRRRTGAANGEFDLKYTYDAAGRLIEVRLFSDATKILKQFAYDDNGRLSATVRFNRVPDLGTIAVTEGWGYHATTGMPARRDLAVGNGDAFLGQTFFHTQAPNDLGGIESITYPCRSTAASVCVADNVARTIEYVYNKGPLSEVKGWAKLSYQPNGMLANVEHGRIVNNLWTATANEAWDADPNGMSRPRKIRVSKGSTQHWSSGVYEFDGSGNISAIGTMKYGYDSVGRLAGWTATSSSSDAYATTAIAYDPFGNQLYMTFNGCGPSGLHCATTNLLPRVVQGTTNHFADQTHDAAGNVLTDSGRTFTYDALNMTTSATVGTSTYRYVYDANDERIAAVELVPGGNRTTWTLRGFRNEVLRIWTREPNGTWTWKEDEIWRGSSLLGLETPQGRKHYALDHLGSPRAILDDDGNLLGLQTFTPFGVGGLTGTGALQFTGHERDRANLGGGAVDLPDYAHARYLDTGGGRFLSVDPVLGEPATPQSWNRYSYARNSPLVFVDPTGETVNLSALTNNQRNELVARLNDFTGNTYDVDKNGLLVLVAVGANSSATATQFLNAAMASNTAYNVASVSGKNQWNTKTGRVEINFDSFKNANYGQVDPRTFNLGSTLVHELVHGVTGKRDEANGVFDASSLNWTGDTVDYVNQMRSERGLPLRASYLTEPTLSGNKEKVRFNHVNPNKPNKIYYVIKKKY